MAAPARAADVVGDPGPRTVTIDSSQLTTTLFTAASSGPSAPIPVDLASGGTFTIPADQLSWGGTAVVAPQVFQTTVSCATFTVSTETFSQSATLAADTDAAGFIDPTTDVAQLDVDATLTAGDISVPTHLVTTGCITSSQDATLSCTFSPVSTHLDLDGDGAHGTDPEAGALQLQDSSVSLPLTPQCSGGGALGSYLSLVTDSLNSLYGGVSGGLDVDATMLPGARAPAAASFDGVPTVTGSAAVGALLTCVPPTVLGVPDPLLTFSWLRDGAAIAAGSTYAVQPTDAEHAIACAVHALNSLGSDDATSSARTIPKPAEPAPQTAGGDSTNTGSAGPTSGGAGAESLPTTRSARPGCVVPKLRGLKLKKAKRKLKKAHCRVGKVKKVKSNRKKGRVIKTKPRAGKHKKAGARVTLIVAR